jgi:hypothetical protein
VRFDEPGDVGPGLQELLHQVVVEELVATLAVDVPPGPVEVVVDLQFLGREAVVGDPRGPRGDARGATDDLAGLDVEDPCALLGGREGRHEARTAGADDRHVDLVRHAHVGHLADGAAGSSRAVCHRVLRPVRFGRT